MVQSVKTTDKVVRNYEVYETYNYDQFQYMEGNRKRDKVHYRSLARKMEKEGNLMLERPIEVNENKFVVDGQNRIEAAKINKMPVYYRIVPNSTISTTISFNTGTKNWGWRDFAYSWANRGNADYKQFVELYENYRFNFNVMLQYSLFTKSSKGGNETAGSTDTPRARFWAGEFTFKDLELTKKLLSQYWDITQAAGLDVRELAYAAYGFMRSPGYKHTLFIDKIRQYGDELYRCYTTADFLLAFEKIYNA